MKLRQHNILFPDDKLDRLSGRVLSELENIDDDTDAKDIILVKIDIDDNDQDILNKFSIPNPLPRLALFEDDNPVQLYEGDLIDEQAALDWLLKLTKEEPPEAMSLKKPDPAKPKESAPPKKEHAPEAASAPAAAKPKPKAEKVNVAEDRKPTKDPKPIDDEPLEDDEKNNEEAEEAMRVLNEKRNVVAFFCRIFKSDSFLGNSGLVLLQTRNWTKSLPRSLPD